jgi:hypothetical protein
MWILGDVGHGVEKLIYGNHLVIAMFIALVVPARHCGARQTLVILQWCPPDIGHFTVVPARHWSFYSPPLPHVDGVVGVGQATLRQMAVNRPPNL